ncbi:hypothetical protein [Ornithinimicrobium cerasi]|uniref:Uncharacterized protein n=1 Tax=Ornithinimicrobium cerasi TaxID=2248773 RepID=A0A285VVB4_9MICO|nr:hypothetical protein [Ornithinimicrobium cerasi]SOC57186.1 hypothetical protein SAMN05421879_11125 [Ornithinimicrobium cerasi]
MPFGPGLEDLLARTLAPLVARQVPVRSLTPGPLEGVARVQWADGTVLLARSLQPGALVGLSRALLRGGRVLATQVDRVDDAADAHAPGSLQTPGVVVVLQPQSRRAGPVRLLVLGLDQPD